MSLPLLLTFCVGLVTLTVYKAWQVIRGNLSSKGLKPLPGPKASFLLGNLRDLPRGEDQWAGYSAISKKLGSDVILFRIFGTSLVVVNTLKAASDLLDKKGTIYSDRPRLPMLKEMLGWKWNLVLMSYDQGFALHRKIVQQAFQASAIRSFHPAMADEIPILLSGLYETPNRFAHHLKRMAGAIIMMVTYGHQVGKEGDQFIDIVEAVREIALTRPQAGASLVDLLPFLVYTPKWLPIPFMRHVRRTRKLASDMLNLPYEMVKRQMAMGSARPCFVSSLMEDSMENRQLSEEVIKNCGGVIYSAGADTTATALTNLFYAMMLHPEVQKQAQAELDRVVGPTRLPTFADKDQTPYLNGILKEVLRWKAVTPLGVPHSTAQSDEYLGSFIPKGATVLANLSAMLHDESVYKDAEDFRPERFIASAHHEPELDPSRIVFGFGRRICPGRFFALDSMWLAMASILHVFTISKPTDENGKEYVPEVKWVLGVVSVPTEFNCRIEVRFAEAKALIAARM